MKRPGKTSTSSGSSVLKIGGLFLLATAASLLVLPGTPRSQRKEAASIHSGADPSREGGATADTTNQPTPEVRKAPAVEPLLESSKVIPMRETKSSERNTATTTRGESLVSSRKGRHSASPLQDPRTSHDPEEMPSAGDSSTKQDEVPAATIAQASMPVVHQFSDEELLAHSPEVPPEVLDTMRENFSQDAGVGQLDPTDPEYLRRWQIAAPSADERYRTLFGWQAFAELQRRAAAEAAQASGGP